MGKPSRYVLCIALVKPGSALHKTWKFAKPVFGIYESDPAFGSEMIRFGDGSWQEITDGNREDILPLPQLGEDAVDSLFG